METICGFIVIADRVRAESTERVILAVADRAHGEREYVTAFAAPRTENPTTWYWGHYFHTGDDDRAFERAVRDYDNR